MPSLQGSKTFNNLKEAFAGDIGYAEGSRVPVKGVSVIGVKDGKLTLAAQLTPTFVPKP